MNDRARDVVRAVQGVTNEVARAVQEVTGDVTRAVEGVGAEVERARGKGARRSGSSTRAERKHDTRRALLDAALRLLADESFSSLSLRQVTREVGIVPTAFYRHFDDMEELGLALVDESFGTLRAMLRAARSQRRSPDGVIEASVDILVHHVHEHRSHFRFIARERSGGVGAVRRAIRGEIARFTSDLATDLGRFPVLEDWSTDDLVALAEVIVTTMVATAESILDAPPDRPEVEAEVIRTARTQLRIVTLGVDRWRSRPPS